MAESDAQDTRRKVFISYSHKDDAWKDKLLPQLNALVQAGVGIEVWHDRRIDAGQTWYPAIEEAMADADVAVLLISADYLASDFCIKEEVPYLLKRQEQEGMLLIPVLIRKCLWKAHRWLADRQMLPGDGKCVALDFPGDLADGVFTDVAERVFDHFAALVAQPQTGATLPKAIHEVVAARVRATASAVDSLHTSRWPALPADRIDLTRLPETGAALFGRDEELRILDQAWSSGERLGSDQTRILAFVAYGGVGKSTLVNHWLQEMQKDHFRGATRVFGWSFYSQGAREEGMASADAFIDVALRFFGDPDPTSGSPWDKGERLARLAGAEQALLVLDGMEPLQSGHAFDKGKLRDPALECLLRGLARESGGLCLVTTREPVSDLTGRPGFVSRDLEQISLQAGRALLRTTRVVGTDAELEALADRFGPHALAVSLLGVYLHEKDSHGGIARAKALEGLPGTEPIDRALAGFEQWLAGTAELEVLRLLGLFDRPADAGCLGALRAKPAIPDLTVHLAEFTDAEWDRVLVRLERLRLIRIAHRDAGRLVVDAHPLLREHFARQLREQHPEAWRAGHRRLYEYLCATTKEGDRPTLADLQPLYQAVAHGCQGGLQQQACAEVYIARILRGTENEGFYSTNRRGAFGSDLGAVACFFETSWSHVSPVFAESVQAWLLSEASARLHGLGRLTEALEPVQAAMEMVASREDWESAAVAASNLSRLERTLGDVTAAVAYAKQSVTYADRSRGAFLPTIFRAEYAKMLHQAGRGDEALKVFEEAERMQGKRQPAYPRLYSVQGFLYCDLLLTDAERAAWQRLSDPQSSIRYPRLIDSCHTVEQRAAQTLTLAQSWRRDILSAALDHLLLGRAGLYRVILGQFAIRNHIIPNHKPGPKSEIEEAVSGLRRASYQDELPKGFLTRAWVKVLEGNADGARADLDEAWEIAARGPMRLHMADIHLYRARLFHAVMPYPWDRDEQGQPRGPKDDLAAARRLIEQCGYWRRKEELEDAEEAAKNW